jgi:hypothetical protein
MWPRLISQLIELLPHATRLMPIADNYLTVRREGAKAQAGAIADLAENLRVDVGRVADSYNGLARQITEQKAQIAALQDAVEVAQTQSMTQTRQLEWITTDVNTLRVWVKFGVVIIVLLLLAVLALTVQILHSR